MQTHFDPPFKSWELGTYDYSYYFLSYHYHYLIQGARLGTSRGPTWRQSSPRTVGWGGMNACLGEGISYLKPMGKALILFIIPRGGA